MNQIDEKPVALITGGAVRVGRAIAIGLADAGFDIAITYLTSSAPAEGLRQIVQSKGRNFLAIRAQLEDPESAAEEISKHVTATFRRLDVLVNNASLYAPDAIGPEATAQSRKFWAIHVESPLLLSRIFSPMLKSAGGCIVNMVDLQAERPIPNYLAYCASKAALWNLTLGLARQLAPQVRVNAIAPGVVEWPPDLPNDKREQYLRRVPLARAGTPQDVANAVEFLVTRAPYMTGQILRIDGGRSIVG